MHKFLKKQTFQKNCTSGAMKKAVRGKKHFKATFIKETTNASQASQSNNIYCQVNKHSLGIFFRGFYYGGAPNCSPLCHALIIRQKCLIHPCLNLNLYYFNR